jgi:hypothetical protein
MRRTSSAGGTGQEVPNNSVWLSNLQRSDNLKIVQNESPQVYVLQLQFRNSNKIHLNLIAQFNLEGAE